jgi:hypothetical protein
MTVTAVRSSQPSSLADILDKGLVIDAFVRVSLVGIELLTIDARIVVASVDTYLRFAEAVNRLDLRGSDIRPPGLPEFLGATTHPGVLGQSAAKARGAMRGMKGVASDIIDTVRRGKVHEEHPDDGNDRDDTG